MLAVVLDAAIDNWPLLLITAVYGTKEGRSYYARKKAGPRIKWVSDERVEKLENRVYEKLEAIHKDGSEVRVHCAGMASDIKNMSDRVERIEKKVFNS